MRRHIRHYRLLILLFLVCAATVRAQAQQEQQQQQQQQESQTQSQTSQPQQSTDQPQQPIPAYHSPLASLAAGNDQGQESNPSDLTPDTRSLAGAQDLGLGMPRIEHSYWQPRFNAISTFDSNPLISTNSGGWVTYTNLLAAVDVHRISGNSDLTLNYTGGGIISSDPSYGNSVIQEFSLVDRISFRRNIVTLFDELSYLPEAGFGYGGLGGLSFPGAGGVGLQTGFLPDQSILTSQGQRLGNSSIAELDHALTPRSTLTFMGGYSLLHFFGSGYFNSGDSIFQAGYNYQLNRHDTIAVLYNFSAYQFGGVGESFDDNRVNIVYGRRVTGRLAFQLGGGPDVVLLNLPANTTGGSGGTGGSGTSTAATSSTQLYWSIHSSLDYALHRGSVAVSYNHGVNGGSGVLIGAVGDTVYGNVTRQLSEHSTAGLHFGYAKNKELNNGILASNQAYSYWFGGADFSHTLGRPFVFTLSYQLQYQNSNSSFCVGSECGGSFTRNTISISLGWHDHPIAF